MKYDITKPSSPKMPELGRGTECLKLMLSQTSKDMHEPLVPMLFPILESHITGVKFQYPDQSWKEPTGMMANLVAESGGNKGQLSNLVEAACHDFRSRPEVAYYAYCGEDCQLIRRQHYPLHIPPTILPLSWGSSSANRLGAMPRLE